jgi:hypothetical protein
LTGVGGMVKPNAWAVFGSMTSLESMWLLLDQAG